MNVDRMVRAARQSGYAALGKRGLSWEIAFGPEFQKLPTLAKLAAMHPDVTMIVNHLGTYRTIQTVD